MGMLQVILSLSKITSVLVVKEYYFCCLTSIIKLGILNAKFLVI